MDAPVAATTMKANTPAADIATISPLAMAMPQQKNSMKSGDIRLHSGENVIDGITVTVVRRRTKRIIVRVKPGGEVAVTIPHWRATLAEGAALPLPPLPAGLRGG